MEVKCENFEQFMEAVAKSVMNGLTFNAYAATLTIVYTGGF